MQRIGTLVSRSSSLRSVELHAIKEEDVDHNSSADGMNSLKTSKSSEDEKFNLAESLKENKAFCSDSHSSRSS